MDGVESEGTSKDLHERKERVSDFECSNEKTEGNEFSQCENLDRKRGIPGFDGNNLVKAIVFLANFALTGSGSAYSSCGSYFTKACLDATAHHSRNTLFEGINPNHEGSAYLRRFKKSCDRALCPVCWGDWANREKDQAVQRIRAFKIRGKPIHLAVSVPKKDWVLSIADMRIEVYKSLRAVHCIGGMLIYHPKRQKLDKSWFFSPHFHVLGYGWILDVRKNYFESGYVVKNLRIRKTLEGTIWYQLSHCGISEDYHTVTWFGALSYNKLKVIYKEPEPAVCELCQGKLRQVMWIGKGSMPLPDIEGVGFLDDPGNWMYKPKQLRSDDIDSGLGEF